MVIADVGGRARDYNGRVTWYVILVALIASSGGLLFGYDLGVTGGVESFPEFLNLFFPEVAAGQRADNNVDPYCSYESQKLSAFTSVLFLSGESQAHAHVTIVGHIFDMKCVASVASPCLSCLASVTQPNSTKPPPLQSHPACYSA